MHSGHAHLAVDVAVATLGAGAEGIGESKERRGSGRVAQTEAPALRSLVRTHRVFMTLDAVVGTLGVGRTRQVAHGALGGRPPSFGDSRQ